MILVCSHCLKAGGCLHLVPVSEAAGQPPPAAAPPQAPAQPQRRQAQALAPLCPVCAEPVGLKRDGSPFPTCYQHR